jgi:hypothetical protein
MTRTAPIDTAARERVFKRHNYSEWVSAKQ